MGVEGFETTQNPLIAKQMEVKMYSLFIAALVAAVLTYRFNNWLHEPTYRGFGRSKENWKYWSCLGGVELVLALILWLPVSSVASLLY